MSCPCRTTIYQLIDACQQFVFPREARQRRFALHSPSCAAFRSSRPCPASPRRCPRRNRGAMWRPHTPQAPSPQTTVDFIRDIQPILDAHCYECHGPKKTKNGLRLDLRAAAVKGGDSGPPSSRRQRAQPIVRRILGLDGDDRCRRTRIRCRPGGRADSRGSIRAPSGPKSARRRRRHGAAAADRSTGPTSDRSRRMCRIVRNTTWIRNDIDRFVLARLDKEGLSPSPEGGVRDARAPRVARPDRPAADALAELDAALADAAANGRDAAYEHLVDRLLASRTTANAGRVRGSISPGAPIRTATKDRLRVMWKCRDS